jgi:hypothetical protein
MCVSAIKPKPLAAKNAKGREEVPKMDKICFGTLFYLQKAASFPTILRALRG